MLLMSDRQSTGAEACTRPNTGLQFSLSSHQVAPPLQGDVEMARLLLAPGANPRTERYRDQMPALSVACEAGQIECVRLLLEAGIEPVPAGGRGLRMFAPLLAAAASGRIEVGPLANLLLMLASYSVLGT